MRKITNKINLIVILYMIIPGIVKAEDFFSIIGGYELDRVQKIAVDPNGSKYAAGWFTGAGYVNEEGKGVFSTPFDESIFLVKLDEYGDAIWAQTVYIDGFRRVTGLAATSQDVWLTYLFIGKTFINGDTIESGEFSSVLVAYDIESSEINYIKTFPEEWTSNSIRGLLAHENGDITFNFTIQDSIKYNDIWLYEHDGRAVLTRMDRNGNPVWHLQHDLFISKIIKNPINNGYLINASYPGFDSKFGDQSIELGSGNAEIIINSGPDGAPEWITYTEMSSPDVNFVSMDIAVNEETGNIAYTALHSDDFTWQGQSLTFDYSIPQTPFIAKFNQSGELLWMNQVFAFTSLTWGGLVYRNGDLIYAGNFGDEGVFMYDNEIICTLQEGVSEGCIIKIDSNKAEKIAQTLGAHAISQFGITDILIDDANDIYIGGSYNTHIFDGIRREQPGTITGFVWRPNFTVNSINDASGPGDKHAPEIFPNPANSKIFIHIPATFNEVSVNFYSLTGSEMLKETIGPGKNTIDISMLEPGMYFMDINNAENQWRKKVIRK